METLTTGPVPRVLDRLYREAEAADRPLREAVERGELDGDRLVAEDAADYRRASRRMADHYLNVTSEFGRFLYMMVRAGGARTVVEFGTSMGISAIHLASALRDGGGGRLITTEMESPKAERARANLEEAGLADLVELRTGDALETLREDIPEVDLLFLDGSISLYLPVLRTLESRLNRGALVIAENALGTHSPYRDHVRDPANGYVSCGIGEERGNEVTLYAP